MRRLILLLCASAICAGCSAPPQKELDRAQGAIDAARAAGAERYASAEFSAATTSLQQAHEAVAQRDHRLALLRALDASERAQQAARQAADGKAKARSDAETELVSTTAVARQLRSAITAAEAARLPAATLTGARKIVSSAEASLQKAGALVKSEQYLEARKALEGVGDQILQQIRVIGEAQKARARRPRT
jgi:Domain of unknown function (DUF4398)